MNTPSDYIGHMFEMEAAAGSPCAVRITRTKDGRFRARMTFAPGMESAAGSGRSVSEALTALALALRGAKP